MFKSMVIDGNMLNWPDYIGVLHIKEKSKPDEVTKLVAGDVIHIDRGSHLVLSTPNKAKGKNNII